MAFLDKALVASAQGCRIAFGGIGKPAQEHGDFLGELPVAGQLIRVTAGQQTGFGLRRKNIRAVGVVGRFGRVCDLRHLPFGCGLDDFVCAFFCPRILRDFLANFLPTLRRVQNERMRHFAGGDEFQPRGGRSVAVGNGLKHLFFMTARRNVVGNFYAHRHRATFARRELQRARLDRRNHFLPAMTHKRQRDRLLPVRTIADHHLILHVFSTRRALAAHITFQRDSVCFYHANIFQLDFTARFSIRESRGNFELLDVFQKRSVRLVKIER